MYWLKTSYLTGLMLLPALASGQYIDSVLLYQPAPGQFVNLSPWGTPHSPASITNSVNGTLSLGAFGGYVVFRFAEPVVNHPDNPFGVDFTIFGNPLPGWSEPGIVSVMPDLNHNGLPDDTWFELAGSEYFFSQTRKNYSVAYENPVSPVAADVPWTAADGSTGFIAANEYYTQPYYPVSDSFPAIGELSSTFSGTCIRPGVNNSSPAEVHSPARGFGYADNHFRGEPPYTRPDNPYTNETENAGGDAFDISWAVDENGLPVALESIDFIRVHTAVLMGSGWLGEVSTEITGAVVTQPEKGLQGPTRLIVAAPLPDSIEPGIYPLEALACDRGIRDLQAVINWSTNLPGHYVDEKNNLHALTPGNLTITAKLQDDPEISLSLSTIVRSPSTLVNQSLQTIHECFLYPNPASEWVIVHGSGSALVHLLNTQGIAVRAPAVYRLPAWLSLSDLPVGLYLVSVRLNEQVSVFHLIRK